MSRIVHGGVITEGLRKKSTALEIEETAVLPSGLRRGGKDEEVKLEEIFLARCQKSREELEKSRF